MSSLHQWCHWLLPEPLAKDKCGVGWALLPSRLLGAGEGLLSRSGQGCCPLERVLSSLLGSCPWPWPSEASGPQHWDSGMWKESCLLSRCECQERPPSGANWAAKPAQGGAALRQPDGRLGEGGNLPLPSHRGTLLLL